MKVTREWDLANYSISTRSFLTAFDPVCDRYIVRIIDLLTHKGKKKETLALRADAVF